MRTAELLPISSVCFVTPHPGYSLVWNYQDDDVSGPATPVSLHVNKIPDNVKRVRLHHYRIDGTHSNAYTAWTQMGSPERLSAENCTKLEAAGQLQLLNSPHWISSKGGATSISFTLPVAGVSLLQVSW